jgi:hypothetical protein
LERAPVGVVIIVVLEQHPEGDQRRVACLAELDPYDRVFVGPGREVQRERLFRRQRREDAVGQQHHRRRPAGTAGHQADPIGQQLQPVVPQAR